MAPAGRQGRRIERGQAVAANSGRGENHRVDSPRLTRCLALGAGALLAVAPASAAAGDGLDARISDALREAGSNRGEIESFLRRYEQDRDAQKRLASRWLVANMSGHGYAVIRLADADGTELAFDAKEHPNLERAKAALDAIEAEHPTASFRKVRFESDLEHASAEFLATHLDRAFEAWRTQPWAKSI